MERRLDRGERVADLVRHHRAGPPDLREPLELLLLEADALELGDVAQRDDRPEPRRAHGAVAHDALLPGGVGHLDERLVAAAALRRRAREQLDEHRRVVRAALPERLADPVGRGHLAARVEEDDPDAHLVEHRGAGEEGRPRRGPHHAPRRRVHGLLLLVALPEHRASPVHPNTSAVSRARSVSAPGSSGRVRTPSVESRKHSSP